MSNARVAGQPRTRLRIHRTADGRWVHRVRQDGQIVGWGWSRSWAETLARGLASLDVNLRFPLQYDEDDGGES